MRWYGGPDSVCLGSSQEEGTHREDGRLQARQRVLGRNQPCPHLDLSFPASGAGRRGFLGKPCTLWSLGRRLEELIPWGSWNVAAVFQSAVRFYSRLAVEFIYYPVLF